MSSLDFVARSEIAGVFGFHPAPDSRRCGFGDALILDPLDDAI